jgi:hypothetical protein
VSCSLHVGFLCPPVLTGWSFSLFGRKGSPYDFAAMDIGRLKEKVRELEDTQKGMKKVVINMIDR